MTKKSIFQFWLLTVFAMSLSYAQADDALRVHCRDAMHCVSTTALDNIQRITFSSSDMSIKPFSGDVDVYVLDNIAKLTFGDIEITDVTTLPATGLDVVVYITPAGEIIVESPVAVQSLTLFNVGGKILRVRTVETRHATSLQTTLNTSTLSTGVYLLRIETQQGIITKKIIKK